MFSGERTESGEYHEESIIEAAFQFIPTVLRDASIVPNYEDILQIIKRTKL